MGEMYRIEWSITLEAEDLIDAASQAWDILGITEPGNSCLFVELYGDDGSDRIVVDMETDPLELEYAPR